MPDNVGTTYAEDTLQSAGNLNIDGFTDEMKRLIDIRFGEDWGSFHLYEPMDEDGDHAIVPSITYDIRERIRSTSHKSLGPVLYDTFMDPADPTIMVKRYRMWFDARMEFSAYHRTNRECMNLLDELEDVLFTYKNHFKNQGISEIIFEAEKHPEKVRLGGKVATKRTLEYMVRIERITAVRSSITNDIEVNGPDGRPTFGGNPVLQHYFDQQKINPRS